MSIPTEWFSAADADGDGRVSGGEAVAFFSRSGLPQATLMTCLLYTSDAADE